MPANRSRTDRWRDCLWQIYERSGAIEISVARADGQAKPGSDLVWRVRILHLSDAEIVVEPPAAFGRSLRVEAGVQLIGAMSIGQNRWMFRSVALGPVQDGRVRLAMPDHVERCQRRSYYRVSAASIELPQVECWHLLDPTSVVAAEVANEAFARDLERSRSEPGLAPPEPEALLPDVGPRFTARLVNISGGGLGLTIPPGESSGIDRVRFLWMRLDLRPDLPAPIALTGRLVHTHIDSGQNVHAGLAFEFGFNPAHREFVIGQVCGLVGRLQARQESAKAA